MSEDIEITKEPKESNSVSDIESSAQDRTAYRSIFKATSLFGGVQVFNILIGIIRTKFVAVLLGATGVGIMGLFNSPLNLIMTVTGLGLTFGAIREISEAHGNNNEDKLSRSVITLRRGVWLTGILGTVVTIVLSSKLSEWTFGNNDYKWAFIWLSITVLIKALSEGQKTIIQGTRRLKDLAKASVYGSIIGLFTAVPLFYVFGLKGIVPALIVSALSALALSWYFSHKVKIRQISMTVKETVMEGKVIAKLGLVITFTGMVSYLTAYILNAFISRTGGVEQVGLYNAGWSIIGQSTGLVFAAMTTDYFPRLSGINKDSQKVNKLVNQQAEMVILILSPIITLLILCMPLIIRILYTAEFLPVVIFANWMLIGIILKGLVWPVGFIFPAKGDMKTFGIIELSALFFNIGLNILGYHLLGLEGLGISFIINYSFGLFLTLKFANKRYGFKYYKSTLQIFIICALILIMIFLNSYLIASNIKFLTGAIILLMGIAYSYIELNKRMNLSSLLKSLYERISNKLSR